MQHVYFRLKIDFPTLKKQDDRNHVKKGISKRLYSLSSKYKELKSPGTILYIMRSIMYAITSNQNCEEKIREELSTVVKHIFGEHDDCVNSNWCKFKQNPKKYK